MATILSHSQLQPCDYGSFLPTVQQEGQWPWAQWLRPYRRALLRPRLGEGAGDGKATLKS